MQGGPSRLVSLLLNCWGEKFFAVGCHRAMVGQTLILARYAGFNGTNRKSIYRQEQIAFLCGEEDNSSPVLHY